jgi:hypothetical protein
LRAHPDFPGTVRDAHAHLSRLDLVAESLLQQRKRTQHFMAEFRGQLGREVEVEPLCLAAETEAPASPAQAHCDASAQRIWHRVDRQVVLRRAVGPEDLQ